MSSHRLRLIVLASVLALFVLAAAAVFLAELWTDEATGVFGTAIGLLTAALVDATRVEVRRRTPGKRAIEDDVE